MQLGSDTPFVTKKNTTGSQVGVGLNTDNFLTSSNDAQIANPRYYRTIKGQLVKAQRKLSRRQLRAKKEERSLRDVKNYQKQRLVVAKVSRQRNNFLHRVSITLINNHDLVVAENLHGKNMLKNHALAMSIPDVGWRTFLNMMEYKTNLYGRIFLTVSPNCHNSHIQDWNASINILAKGLEKLAKEEAYLLLDFQSVDTQ